MIAQVAGQKPGEFVHTLGDAHNECPYSFLVLERNKKDAHCVFH